jgi:hypothetical protein
MLYHHNWNFINIRPLITTDNETIGEILSWLPHRLLKIMQIYNCKTIICRFSPKMSYDQQISMLLQYIKH